MRIHSQGLLAASSLLMAPRPSPPCFPFCPGSQRNGSGPYHTYRRLWENEQMFKSTLLYSQCSPEDFFFLPNNSVTLITSLFYTGGRRRLEELKLFAQVHTAKQDLDLNQVT
jgi:hypothetical protein